MRWGLNRKLGGYAQRKLTTRRVEIITRARVSAFVDGIVKLTNGDKIVTDTLIWTAVAARNQLIAQLPCPRAMGGVIVDDYLAIKGWPGVWAMGDCAHVIARTGGPYPPTAQHALRDGQSRCAQCDRRFIRRAKEIIPLPHLGTASSDRSSDRRCFVRCNFCYPRTNGKTTGSTQVDRRPKLAFCECPEIGFSMNCLEKASVNYLRCSQAKMGFVTLAWAIALLAHLTLVPSARAASHLALAPNLSFDDDSSPRFPIRGRNLSDGQGPSGEATIIFFGTSNCWNTAREAERLVKLYPQFHNRVHFVIVDLRNMSPAQQPLVSDYYHGYIPTITALSSGGNVIYNRAGETATIRGDTSNLQRLLDSLH